MTSVEPSQGPHKVHFDNYDDRGQVTNSQRLWPKVDWVVKLKMDRKKLKKVKKVKNSKGDVYLHEGDVNLANYQYSIDKNTNTKD